MGPPSALGFGPWGITDSGGGISCETPWEIILLGATYTAIELTDSIVRENSALSVGGGVATLRP